MVIFVMCTCGNWTFYTCFHWHVCHYQLYCRESVTKARAAQTIGVESDNWVKSYLLHTIPAAVEKDVLVAVTQANNLITSYLEDLLWLMPSCVTYSHIRVLTWSPLFLPHILPHKCTLSPLVSDAMMSFSDVCSLYQNNMRSSQCDITKLRALP